MFTTATNTHREEIDLDQLFTEQAAAIALYELALTYKSFGFRDKAIIEYYHLCDMNTASAEHYATMLTPMLFN